MRRASVLGIPNERFAAGAIAEGYRRELAAAQLRFLADRGHDPLRPWQPGFDLLAVSGGGEDAAFGAGVLTAWRERPEFQVVTDVSTAASTAPFAFLGPAWDGGLEEVYTRITPRDLAIRGPWTTALFDDALAETAPLFRTISRHLDERMLEEIASAYRRRRLLLIGTTNLDAGVPVIWNVGAIAASGHPRALETVRKVLLASASLPGVFPPVLFDVTVDGRVHPELYVDGGRWRSCSSTPPPSGPTAAPPSPPTAPSCPPRTGHPQRTPRSQLDGDGSPYVDHGAACPQHPVGGVGLRRHEARVAGDARDEVEFRLADIGEGVTETDEEPFDPASMRALFGHAQRRTREGNVWMAHPPGLG
ncbi:MAG: patatin-like phospholipase family protein [Elioraea sp.]|nr:patatin-like phospholipase family protein [Elioraea sp.]